MWESYGHEQRAAELTAENQDMKLEDQRHQDWEMQFREEDKLDETDPSAISESRNNFIEVQHSSYKPCCINQKISDYIILES